MEGISSTWDMGLLISVLNEGNQYSRELQIQLQEHCPIEDCKWLARRVQSAFETAIAVAKLQLGQKPKPAGSGGSQVSAGDSPSPRSECSEKVFKELERREVCKKRKTMPRWNGQVRVSSGASMESPTDDGHNWRKYGQKDILGSKFPRGYYRCTHRHTHGCLATKQVQRSDEDPSIFDISYRGAHTCSKDHRLPTAGPPPEDRTLQRISPPIPPSDRQQPQPLSSQILRTSLKVEIEGLSSDDHQLGSSPSFSFPSTPESCTNKPENHLLWNYSQAFLTAASPETRFFSPPSPLVVNNSGAGEARLQSSEVSGILSAADPATSSQPVAVVFQPEQLEFDAEFPFDFSS